MNLNLSINDAFYHLLDSTYKYNILKGAAGSGKSVFMRQNIILDLIKNPGKKWVGLRKNGADIERSIWAELNDQIDLMGVRHLFKSTKKPYIIKCIHNGSSIILSGLDDHEKIKSISERHDIWLEEATQFTRDDWMQLNLRLRGQSNYKKRYWLSFNPVSEDHWIKHLFFDTEHEDCILSETTYLDNQFLTEDDHKNYERYKNIDDYYYKVYCLGEWGDLNNAKIFNNYIIHDYPIDTTQTIYQGIDWGYNDPTAFIRCYIKDQELYIFEEMYETELTNEDIMSKINSPEIKSIMTIADSSEPARVEAFRRAGWNIRSADKGPDSILSGVMFIKSFKKVHIHTACRGLSKEALRYKWTEKKGEIWKDKPVDADNHAWDAVRYALETYRKNLQRVYRPSRVSFAGVGGI